MLFRSADSARVYGHALAKEYSQADTLYLHGDTISTFRRVFLPEVADDGPRAMLPAMAPVAVDSISADSISDGAMSAGVMALDSMAVDSIPVDSVAAAPVIPDSVAAVMMPADSVATAIPPKAEPALPDTVHYLVAYPNVKFFRVDLQGLCDSMTFVSKDSLLHLDKHPVVWNENKQIFGNKIILHLNDSTVDWARLPEFGFVAEHIDEEFYNQLTGKEMFATFDNGELRHLDVSGNVQAIMLPQENDSTYNKIANLESSYMAADFLNQELRRMKLWPETSGTMTPLYLAKKQLYYLPQFRWFEPLRPRKPEDVFVIPQEMRDLFAEPPFGTSRRQ